MDFTIPMGQEATTLVGARSTGQSTQFWVYIDIFPMHVWGVGVASVLLLGAGFYVVHASGVDCLHEAGDEEEFTAAHGVAVAVLLVWQESYRWAGDRDVFSALTH